MTEQTKTPTGAILNGREFARRLDADYDFQDEGGPLSRCADWDQFKARFERLALFASSQSAPAPAPAPAVTVKPLEFLPTAEQNGEIAVTLFGHYAVWEDRWQVWMGGSVIKQCYADNLEANKAGAQADYERRILSVIQPAPIFKATVEYSDKDLGEEWVIWKTGGGDALMRHARAEALREVEDAFQMTCTTHSEEVEAFYDLLLDKINKAEAMT